MTIVVKAGVFRSRRRLYLMSRRNASMETSSWTGDRRSASTIQVGHPEWSKRFEVLGETVVRKTKAPSRRMTTGRSTLPHNSCDRLSASTANDWRRNAHTTHATAVNHVATNRPTTAAPRATAWIAMIVVADH